MVCHSDNVFTWFLDQENIGLDPRYIGILRFCSAAILKNDLNEQSLFFFFLPKLYYLKLFTNIYFQWVNIWSSLTIICKYIFCISLLKDVCRKLLDCSIVPPCAAWGSAAIGTISGLSKRRGFLPYVIRQTDSTMHCGRKFRMTCTGQGGRWLLFWFLQTSSACSHDVNDNWLISRERSAR